MPISVSPRCTVTLSPAGLTLSGGAIITLACAVVLEADVVISNNTSTTVRSVGWLDRTSTKRALLCLPGLTDRVSVSSATGGFSPAACHTAGGAKLTASEAASVSDMLVIGTCTIKGWPGAEVTRE